MDLQQSDRQIHLPQYSAIADHGRRSLDICVQQSKSAFDVRSYVGRDCNILYLTLICEAFDSN